MLRRHARILVSDGHSGDRLAARHIPTQGQFVPLNHHFGPHSQGARAFGGRHVAMAVKDAGIRIHESRPHVAG